MSQNARPASSKLRTPLFWLGAVILCTAAYVYAMPFITVYQIRLSLEQRDPAALAEHVDFPQLRENVKTQISAAMMRKMGENLLQNPLGTFALGLGSKVTDSLVDVMVTPAGVTRLLTGKDWVDSVKKGELPEISPEPAAAAKPLAGARYGYDNWSEFSVYLPDGKPDEHGKEGEIRFVLARAGFSWKLTNIVVPFGP